MRRLFETPTNWRVDYPQAAQLTNLRWWEQFQDPVLNQLVETALRNNQDIRIAAERVEQYLGQLQTTRSQFFPQLSYGLEVSRNQASTVSYPPSSLNPWYKLYQGSASADWQIDLFGRVRRQSEAAQAQVFASEQGRRGTLLTVVSSVAAGYITRVPRRVTMPVPCVSSSCASRQALFRRSRCRRSNRSISKP